MALLASAGAQQKLPWEDPPGAQQLVHFLYPQQVTLPAGKAGTIDLHFRINEGCTSTRMRLCRRA